jgi:superfamily II DNA or RNA helicase
MITEFKDVDTLSPNDFEIFVRDVLVAAGWYDAVITEVGKEYRHGDGGVDIFAYKNKRKFAIEVKQRSENITVDVGALNQLVTGAKLANVTSLILVTNSYFTSEVIIRAMRLGVELIDRDQLQNLWLTRESEIGRGIKPRKYQESIIEECIQQYLAGKNKFLIEMATGLGKTYTVAHIVKRIFQENESPLKILFLAHQVEILMQSVTAFKNVLGIGSYTFSVCIDGSNPDDTDFVFATFDTLYSKIHDLKRNMFDIVIIDEAHHTPAKTYSSVAQHFHPKLLLGLTATPMRADGQDVLKYFGGNDGHLGKYDLAWALKHNKLAFPKYVVLLDDIDQKRLDQLDTGLSISDLDQRLFLHKKDEEVVAIIEKTVRDKEIENVKGIVFCRSIAHMNYLVQFFELGSATVVHSKMTNLERRDNIRGFREGSFRYILVCDLFNEGIDIPETNLLVFMRYTGSQTIWLQQLGRGLRKTPNKEYVHVLDFVGSLERLNEVQRLRAAVDRVVVQVDDLDSGPLDTRSGAIHDSTLDVTYSQSAAQVLKLIEELKYRLNSRGDLINALRIYVETYHCIPHIFEIENALNNVSYDQISTHFDSFYRYVSASVSTYFDEFSYRQRISEYIEDFEKKYGITPSVRAVSGHFRHKGLLEFSEPDVLQLMGDAFTPRRVVHINEINDAPEELHVGDISSEQGEVDMINVGLTERAQLIKKYFGKVTSVEDMKKMDAGDRAEVKKYFNSNFLFLRMLSESSKDE